MDASPRSSMIRSKELGDQTPVVFRNRKGLRLYGILHTPHGRQPGDLAVVLLSPGVKMRVGPQRLYLPMTKRFLSLGLSVLRLDFHGLGDSDGALPEEQLRDVYNHIEVGRFVEDTIDALNWLQQTHGCRRFLLSGLCGGAITGLLAGQRDARVAGLIGLGITPVLASRAADASKYVTVGQLEAFQKMYIRRLLAPQAWFRLLTFQTDNRLIGRMIAHWTRKLLRRAPPPPAATPPPEGDNSNPLFPPAFFRMLSTRRPMLLVFGGADRLHWEYEEKFASRYKAQLAEMPPLVDVHVVDQANHTLSFREWQDEMLEVSTRWLNTHFVGDLAVQPRAASVQVPAVSHS
jgi:pimeloyl-ACP methyl ester carboxylesterase